MSGLPNGPLNALIDADTDRPDSGVLHAFLGSMSALLTIDPSMPISDAVPAAVDTALKVTSQGGDRP